MYFGFRSVELLLLQANLRVVFGRQKSRAELADFCFLEKQLIFVSRWWRTCHSEIYWARPSGWWRTCRAVCLINVGGRTGLPCFPPKKFAKKVKHMTSSNRSCDHGVPSQPGRNRLVKLRSDQLERTAPRARLTNSAVGRVQTTTTTTGL